MDTNNEPQINSFAGGLNSDDDLSVVATNQYIDARNIKISSYRGGESRDNRHGSLMPVQGVKLAGSFVGKNNKVVATGSIRDYGVIVCIDKSNLKIYSFKNAIGGTLHDQDFNNIQYSRLVTDAPLLPLNDGEEYPDVFNIQLNYESENNIKLYLADSFHPIMVFNINRDDRSLVYNDLNKCLSYPEAVCKPPVFEEYVPGKIEFGVVSYCYQLYNRYGIHTDASIQCQQIPIGNYDFDEKYIKCGGKQGAISNCGVKISIQIPSNYRNLDYIKVFRVQYTQNGQMPIVSIIYDAKIDFDEHNFSELIINDVGNEPIEQISVEELNSLQGVRIIPNSLASKDGFLFAANIKTIQTTIKGFDKWDARAFRFNCENVSTVTDINGDNTFIINTHNKDIEDDSVVVPPFDHDCYDGTYNNINKEVSLRYDNFVFDSKYRWIGGSGKNIEWRFVISSQVEDSCIKENNTRKIGTLYNYSQKENIQQNNVFYIDKDFKPSIIEKAEFDPGINNNTWLIKSLRRNEIYRYGIVLYDKYCQASPVKWIADIRTPNVTEEGFYLMSSNTIVNDKRYELVIRNLGIQFMVKSLPEGCTGYQIVRCARHESDIATISQGVLSLPVSNAYSKQYEGDNANYEITKYHMFCPTGFLTTNMFIEGYDVHNQLVGDGKDKDSQCMTNIDNDKLLQFVSKEICYQPESFKQFIKDKKYYLQKQSFLFGARGDYKFSDDQYDSPRNGNENTDYGSLTGFNGRTNFKFIIPCISNCAVELFTGPYDNGDARGTFYVNSLTVNNHLNKNSTICYLDAPYNPSYFYKVNPQSHKFRKYEDSLMIGGLGNVRPYSYSLIKDCILNFDRLYNRDNESADKRQEKAGKFIIQKAFAYIKLYEQSTYPHQVITSDDDWFISTQRNYIQDFQLVDQIKWDQAFKRNFNKDNDEQASSKAYTNYAVSAGGALFTNMVTGGICNDTNSNIFESFGNYNCAFQSDGTGNPSNKPVCFGTGGKCLLLSCYYKEKCTAGADSYYYPKNGNYYDSFEEEPYKTEPGELGEMFKIVRPTLLGTYLTNLRQQITPYGGYSFTNRLTNIYYGDGNYFESKNDWNTVFDGDCHIETFEYTSMHKVYGAYTKSGKSDLQFPNTHMITYSIPTESNIWCRFQYGWTFSSNARDNYASFIQAEPCEITEAYVQKEPEYVYNSVYSVQNTSIPFAVYDDLNPKDYNKTIDTRVYYSDLKQNDEIIDSWCKFRSSNFIDVDQQYGPITDIYTFKNALTFCQEKSFGVLSVNDRSVATDNSGQNIVLGTGGVLDRYDYYSNTYGMHKQQFCAVCTTGGLYWFDSHNNVICLFDGQSVVQLSKQCKVQNILNKYKKDNNFKVFYNNRYNEVVFNVLSYDMQIVYNEMLGKFTSTLTIPFDGAIQFFNGEYLVKKNDNVCVYQYDYLDGSPKSTNQQLLSSYIKYVVAQQPLVTKVFDNQEIVTYENLQLQDVIYDKDDYFSKNHKYTWQTESQKIESSLEEQITLRENNHRFAIPRADGLFGNRARGKVMICSIEDVKPNPAMAIQYIITKYRQSWS